MRGRKGIGERKKKRRTKRREGRKDDRQELESGKK